MGIIFLQLVTQQCCIASCDCLLPVLQPLSATNFHVSERKQQEQENLLHTEVIKWATNNRNLQCKLHDKLQNKMLPVLLGLNVQFQKCP